VLGVVIKSCFAGADRGVREIGLEPPPQSAGARVKRDDHGGQNAAQELPSQDHCSSISDEMSMNRLTKPSAQMPPGNLASYDRDSGDAVPSLMRSPLYHAICPGNGLTGHVANCPVTFAFEGPLGVMSGNALIEQKISA